MHVFFTFLTLLTAALAAQFSTVYEFSNGTWLENIALMRNGSLLATVIGRADVHIINPLAIPTTSSLVTSFPQHNSVLGISELEHDKFAVAVGNTTPANSPVEGSFAIFIIDFANCAGGKGKVDVEKVVDLKNVSMVNGITKLNAHTLLLADSWAGNVVKLDLRSKKYSVALEDASLKSDFTNPTLPLGVNGLRFQKESGYLYYTNTVQSLLGRVKLDTRTAKPMSRYEVIVKGEAISQPDDFAVARDGSVYLARPIGDTVQHVKLNGKVEVLGKGGLASGATSVIMEKDGKTLFVSESGLEGGVPAHGGRVVKIEL
jgi:hypothetical protein